MKALVLRANARPDAPLSSMLERVERPVPSLRSGDLLVKMEAASANPSDALSMRGGYSFQRASGEVCGIEGCGRVVASDAGLLGFGLRGRRVAVGNQGGDGVWAEYARIEAKYAIPIGDSLPVEAAAAFIVNPFSSYALMHRARELRATVVVQNAGASQVCRGTLALGKRLSIPTISLVRKQSQVDEIVSLGGEAFVQDAKGEYLGALRDRLAREKRAAFLDAVGGKQSAEIMTCLPSTSTTIVYGFLADSSKDPVGTYAMRSLVFGSQRIEPYWLTAWFASLGTLGALKASIAVKGLFTEGVFSTRVAQTCAIDEYAAALDAYEQEPSRGKALLRFA